jgi:hypothetical protein
MFPPTVLYYGSNTPLPEPIALRAGPLTMLFEPATAFLRYIRLGDYEVLRGVYAAVRDRNWGTVPPRLSNLQLQQEPDAFQLTFDVECRQNEIVFQWHGSITGTPAGTLTCTMDGQAVTTFLRNRIGLCVLHPVRECAGRPCMVQHPDGSWEQGTFPRSIAPHQPFIDICTLAHEVLPNAWAVVQFEGEPPELWEMEDQRNWTDGSFKTYCTPLRLPFPVEVQAGTRIRQTVRLTWQSSPPRSAAGELAAKRPSGERPSPVLEGVLHAGPRAASTERVLVVGDTPVARLPRLGLGMASHGQRLTPSEQAQLRALHLDLLRADLLLGTPGWRGLLQQASAEAAALGASLELAIFLTDAAEDDLAALAAALSELRPPVAQWLIFHVAEKTTTLPWIRLARRYLAGSTAKAKLGAGTNAYFTELNRQPPPVEELDLVCYSITPQVHAFDNASLVETLEIQAETVVSARRFTGTVPIAITPVTLRPRFNPNATGPAPEPAPGELPPQVDVRQMSLFGAGWTLGSLKYLAQSGVYSVTYYETTGWRGVMETQAGSPMPQRFPSLPGAVFPLYHVLADAGEYKEGAVLPAHSSAPLQFEGFALQRNDRVRVMLANLGPAEQRVRVRCPLLGRRVRLRSLDETTALPAMRTPETYRISAWQTLTAPHGDLLVELRPFAYCCIENA